MDAGTQCELFPYQMCDNVYTAMLQSLSLNITYLQTPGRSRLLSLDDERSLQWYVAWACDRTWECAAALAYVATHADDAMLHSRGPGSQPAELGGKRVPYASCVMEKGAHGKVTRYGQSVAVNVCCTDFKSVHPSSFTGVESAFRGMFPIQTGLARLFGRRPHEGEPWLLAESEAGDDRDESGSELSVGSLLDDGYDDFLHTGDFFLGDDDLDDYGSD